MINQRKRNLVVIIFSIFMITKVFSMEQVATTYKTNLTPTDMVEIFLETISHYAKYSYQIWDYEVYTKDDQQNYAWSVYTDDKGYTTNKYIVKESSVYLYLKNGWIAFYTFGGETTLKSKVCLNVNEGDNYTKIYNSCKNAIMNYRAEGEKWLNRYKKTFREDEIIALNKLCGIIGIFGSYNLSDYTGWFDDYAFINDLTDDKIAALHWNKVTSFSTEIRNDYYSKILADKSLSSIDLSAIPTYSVYIEDILKRKGLPLISRGELSGFENLLNASYENIKETKKDGKVYYIIMSQTMKIYRYVEGTIVTTDTGLTDVVIIDIGTKKMYSAYYTEKDGIIYIYKDYVF